MNILNPRIDLEKFYERCNHASQKALLLDYDGTLAPFHVDPSKAYPYPGVPEMLDRIMKAPDMRLVIITGRWIKGLMPLLKLKGRPEIWGSHGIERLRMDGSYEIAPMDENALDGLVKADEWIQKVGLGERCEEKPGCLAIHWRGLDEKRMKEIANQVRPTWQIIAHSSGLSLKEFDGGIELRVPARDKGDAVRTILEEVENDAAVAYLGDDLTDEDAFRAIKGKGIGVLVRKELRPTASDLWIKPPEELLEFLSGWLV
ncbi:MAG: trehalose-phosphatase [Desulfobacteraceae bacterium]|jgi:trehalose-phosphatase